MEKITSRKNDIIVHMKKLGASAGYRRDSGEFVCDGIKLLNEAARWNADIHTVLCTEGTALPKLDDGVRVCQVPEDVLASASQFKTPQSVMFSCALPRRENTVMEAPYIVLENVQDPGNVGTVVRTADAFGINVILVGACADPFSPKTLRAAMGAMFRRRVLPVQLDELIGVLGSVPLYGAALGNMSRDIRETDVQNAAVAIGSEGRGLSEELLEMCTGRIIIPMLPKCESLNAAAAAAVTMWEMARNRLDRVVL